MKVNEKFIISILLLLTIFSIISGVNANDALNEDSVTTDTSIQEDNTDKTSTSNINTNLDKTNNIDNDEKTKTNSYNEKKEDKTENIINTPKSSNSIYVSTNGSDSNDGKTRENSTTLNNAINIVGNGSTIYIGKGYYKIKDLGIISTDVNITGEDEVILDGDNKNRILYMGNTSNVVIKNIILINGYTPNIESGALLGNAGNLTIINCTFKDSNSEKNGGAIYNAGNLIVINSTFENNYADKNGGAIFSQNGGIGIIPTLIIDKCVFRNNTAKGNSRYGGGAVYIQSASSGNSLGLSRITNTLFENNKVIDYGGGAIEVALTSEMKIDNCSFINNHANGELYSDQSDYGGGAISFIGSYGSLNEVLTITNTLFLNNSVKNYGGGAVYARYSKVDIKNSVLINNTDEAKGYAVYRRRTDMNTAKITANDNWWGSNDNPKSKTNSEKINRWVILTINNETEIEEGKTVKIVVKLDSYTNGLSNGTLTNPIMIERPLLICTNLGDIEGKLVNGEYRLNYTILPGLKIISTKVDSQQEVLFVLTSPVNLEISNISGHMGNRINYSVNVTTTDDTVIINTGNVEIYFDNDLVKTIPVVNGVAKDTIMIAKNIGEYLITVKFIDLTHEFEDKEEISHLTVDGMDNIVNQDTFINFFDENNILKSDVPFDEIFFEGEIKNKILTINKSLKLIGNNTLFNNTGIKITSNNVNICNITFIADEIFEDICSVIYSEGENTIIENNNITYTAPNSYDSYAIYFDSASKSNIINNNINYSAYLGLDTKTIALYIVDSDDSIIKNNTFNISIPSASLADYGTEPYYYGTVNSAGVVIEYSKKIKLDHNTIKIKYSDYTEFTDTINGVHIKFCDKSNITHNNIELQGHSYSYALYIDGSENVDIYKNNILAKSDADQANTISVNGKTSIKIEDNNITAIAELVVYPIYLNDAKTTSKANIINNNITGISNLVYGIYSEEKQTNIIKNNILIQGNYTMGITSHKTEILIENNTINSKGSNIGEALKPQGGVPVETVAICTSNGNIEIKNNKLISNGNYTVDAINSNGLIKDNYLISANNKGDLTIKNSGSVLEIDNNKTSTIDEPINHTPDNSTVNPKDNDTNTNTKNNTVQTKNDPVIKPLTTNKNKSYKIKIVLTLKKVQKISKRLKRLILKITIKNNGKKIKVKKISLKIRKVKIKKTLKNYKFNVKIKGKQYTQKTNKKGQAIFKIINLYNKGKYTAKFSYKHNKSYKNIKFILK